jgi:hypothetical protein
MIYYTVTGREGYEPGQVVDEVYIVYKGETVQSSTVQFSTGDSYICVERVMSQDRL